MRDTFDPPESERNIALRGISFGMAVEFEWSSALVLAMLRQGASRQFEEIECARGEAI